MHNQYAMNGETPIFPIVGSDGGYSKIAGTLNVTGYIGATYLIHPDGSYEGSYKGGSDYGVGFYLDKAGTASTGYSLTVNKGSGSGSYDADEEVAVSANTPEPGFMFETWIGDTQYVANPSQVSTVVTMPSKNIEITATYIDTTSSDKFTLTVIKGSGDGEYGAGDTVSISADSPNEGFIFEGWTGDSSFVLSTNSSNTKVVMPDRDITVVATYRDTTGSDIDTTNPVSIMFLSGWEGGSDDALGSEVTIDTSKLKTDTLINATITLGKSNMSKNQWAWAKASAYLAGHLKGVTAVSVSYSASDTVYLVLDQDNLGDAGTSYQYKLAPTGRGFKTELIDINSFSQPAWHTGSEALELEKVKSLSFTNTKEESTLSLSISELILYNYNPVSVIEADDIISNDFQLQNVTSSGITFSIETSGVYKLELYAISGRLIWRSQESLSIGTHSISLPTLAKEVHLLLIESGEQQSILKIQ